MVDAGLAAGRGVQIGDDIEPCRRGPADDAVEQGPALARDLAVGRHEQTIVQRHPHHVEADGLDELDIVLGDVGVAVLPPECGRALRSQKAVEGAKDLARCLGDLELEHIALGHQPVAEADALEVDGAAVGGDEVLAFDADEPTLRAGGRHKTQDQKQGHQQQNGEEAHDGTVTAD